jgi:hypothetical protein
MRLCHWYWLLLGFILVVVPIFFLPYFRSSERLLPTLTLVCGVFYFFHQQSIEKARFFKALVTEFNQRYDVQNDKLFGILNNKKPLEEKEKQVLVDYFNLCAEEYLFHNAGYIDNRVWKAWQNGMKQFGKDHRVSELWQKEKETDSYYGFEFLISG